jgi:2-haloacid dehalogenase
MSPGPSPTGPTSPTTIVWDLGNVFIRWNPRRMYQQLFPDTDAGRVDMERFLATVVPMHTFNARLDRGEAIESLCAEAIAAHPTYDPSLVHAYANWRHMLDGLIHETVAMFRATKQRGVKGYALSNWGNHFVEVIEEYPVFKEFDGRVVSYELGIVKPDPEIFRVLLDRFNLRAEECLFVDDSRANIDAAKQLGFHVHHFTDPQKLRARLHDLELLPIAAAPGWGVSDSALHRRFEFANFTEAWSFMTDVAAIAERLDHHPDWSNSWNTVDISLTSHDRKSTLTGRDFAMAEAINDAWEQTTRPKSSNMTNMTNMPSNVEHVG